jgi:hypothetical protein
MELILLSCHPEFISGSNQLSLFGKMHSTNFIVKLLKSFACMQNYKISKMTNKQGLCTKSCNGQDF